MMFETSILCALDPASAAAAAADYASKQTDRWLFIATLIVGGVAAFYVARYFVRVYEKLVEDYHRASLRYEANMERYSTAQQAAIVQRAEIMTRTTDVLERCRESMDAQSKQQSECARITEEWRRRFEDRTHK